MNIIIFAFLVGFARPLPPTLIPPRAEIYVIPSPDNCVSPCARTCERPMPTRMMCAQVCLKGLSCIKGYLLDKYDQCIEEKICIRNAFDTHGGSRGNDDDGHHDGNSNDDYNDDHHDQIITKSGPTYLPAIWSNCPSLCKDTCEHPFRTRYMRCIEMCRPGWECDDWYLIDNGTKRHGRPICVKRDICVRDYYKKKNKRNH